MTATLPLGVVRTRKRERMVIDDGDKSRADPATVRLLARAFAAREVLLTSANVEQAAASLGYSRDYVVALARLSYLASPIVTAILDGQIDGSSGQDPFTRVRLPLGWEAQRALLKAAWQSASMSVRGGTAVPFFVGHQLTATNSLT